MTQGPKQESSSCFPTQRFPGLMSPLQGQLCLTSQRSNQTGANAPKSTPLSMCWLAQILAKGLPLSFRETCKSHHRLHVSQDRHPVTTQAVDPICGIIKHSLCARHWVWLFLGCLMPGPKASSKAACPDVGQSASISDFNPNSGLGLQAACPGIAWSGTPWHAG